jgi:DNA-binding NarL/FixJ family response regulator
MKIIQLLIADDHQLLLDGISSILSDEAGINIAGKASNGFEVLELAALKKVDVCLLDISMPGMDGIATAKLLKEKIPALKIIILTTYNDRAIVEEMLAIGVSGYMLKNSGRNELVDAIEKVFHGGLYFSAEVHELILKDYIRLNRAKKFPQEIILTQREKEILQLLAMEYTNDKIAAELNISYRTVETHRKNLMHKTKAHNLAGLLKYAYQNSLLS